MKWKRQDSRDVQQNASLKLNARKDMEKQGGSDNGEKGGTSNNNGSSGSNNGSSGSNNSQGKSDSKNTTSVPNVSGLPSTCSASNNGGMQNGCQIVNENDGALQYSNGWTLVTGDPNGLKHTLHFTNATGSSVSLIFNSSSIIVFGLVPPGTSPPLASYSIDGSLPTAVNLGATTQCIPNQQLFSSPPLVPGLHNLTIFVNQTSAAQPYILDYLWLCKGSSLTVSANRSSESGRSNAHGSQKTLIVGTIVGTIVLVLVIALGSWWYVRRRKRLLRLRRLRIASSPVASWLYWNSSSDEKDPTLFTSSEEILAGNPTTPNSSPQARWSPGSRKKVPSGTDIPQLPRVRSSVVSKATSLSRGSSVLAPHETRSLISYPQQHDSRASSVARVF